MTAQRRATLCLTLGLLALVLPVGVWAYIVVTVLNTPEGEGGQGGLLIMYGLFPLGLLGTLVFGIPAMVLGSSAGEGAGRRRTGIWLSVLGLLLATGTCFGPQMLATLLR